MSSAKMDQDIVSSASDIRKMTLAELRAALQAMMSPEWDAALTGKSRDEITEAARLLLAVQRARLRLENAALKEIRGQLLDNAVALRDGCRQMADARQNLEMVVQVTKAAAKLLQAVARVVPLVI